MNWTGLCWPSPPRPGLGKLDSDPWPGWLRPQVLPGARVPTDGEVTEGNSFVDESMLTGEPEPVAKGPGAAVIGGTVNVGGPLRIRAAR